MKLTATRLRCQRGERLLFEDCTLAASAGDMLVLTGPNGVGKSSLLRILAGLLAAQEGTVAIDASTLGDEAPVHYLGHRDALRDALSVGESLDFVRSMLGAPGRGLSVDQALDRLRALHLLSLPVGVLSAGQKRRVALAGLLCAGRPIWLLDEPTTALDADGQALAAGLFRDHCAAGGIVIAATHLPLGIGAREIRLGGSPSAPTASPA
ncbi:MAG: heme ABC exporter ATP-binding protein CcmA [Beijerinckiaceae bacterium]|nr:heme ABC exporter ATP-binding protein CcmA [Beijerinckiaceae bacterium]